MSERGQEGTTEHSHCVWGQAVLLGLHFQRRCRGRGMRWNYRWGGGQVVGGIWCPEHSLTR